MKKIYFLFLSIFFLSLPSISYSQGGNTCAIAASNPIAIPYNANGSICGTVTNDYNMVGAGCIDPLNTQGPDYLYYFCAPSTGNINITLNNFIYYCLDPLNVAPFPALSIWQGCPGVGSCVAGSTSQGTPYLVTSPETAVELPVTAGQCYYILIDNYPGYCPCFDYTIAVNYIATPPTQPACTNMGFDAGGFAGWTGTYGYTVRDGATGAPTPIYTPAHYAFLAPHHTITSGVGVDPFGGFPVVFPGGGPNSCRLGDGTGYGYGGASLEQTFNVAVTNALLTYNYAVVIQDANSIASAHASNQQPFYRIEVFDCSGNPITCGQYLVVGGPGIPGFTLAPGTTDVYYKPWTPVSIDLTPYISSCVKIKFTVGDCSLGAHFAYAYLDVNCAPMAITGINMICPGTSTILSAPPGEAAYSWAPGGQTTSSVTVSPAATTTYTCTVTSVSGPTCTSVLTYPVGLYPSVTATSTSQTICAGASATITATPSSLGGTYAWSPGGQTTASITISPAITTAYICTYTDLNGCTDTALGTITVNPLPVVTVNSPAICVGQTANLVASGATTYIWSAGATSTGVNTATATPVVTTTYTVTGTTSGCTNTAISTVTVNTIPAVTVNSPAICAGQTANLIATGGTTYTWSVGATSTGINTADATPASTTTYTVTGTTSGCSGTAVATVTVNPLPVVTVNSPTVCAGTISTLTANGATTYTWSAGTTSTGVNTADTSPTSTATYTVTGTSLGCTSTAIATITVNPIPVSTAGPDIVFCTGSTGIIGGAAVSGYNYIWTPATGLSSTNVSNPTVTLINAGTSSYTTVYSVITTASATGCQSSASVNVTVDAVATANAGSTQFVCSGSGITLAGAIGGSATSAVWSGGGGTYSPNNTTLNAVYTATAAEYAAGTVTLTLTTNDPAGPCTFASSNVTFNFYQLPVANFTVVNPTGCPIQCASFTDMSTITAPDVIVSWAWDFDDAGATSTLQNPSHCYPLTGVYAVTLTVTSNNECAGTVTIMNAVTVFAVPIAEFNASPNPTSIFEPEVSFTDQSSPPTPASINYWFWDFGDGTTSAPSTQHPLHTYPNVIAGNYVVTLIVQNSDGCWDTIRHDIVIGPEFTFYIPNCFTPNGDGTNDVFYGDGVGIVDYDIWIFDRWGNMIFHGDYLHDVWDGRANGGVDVAQQDVYVWKVKLTDVFTKIHTYIGTVTIVK